MSTATQPLEALAVANRVRLGRVAVKRRVRSGDLTAAEVIADPPGCCRSMAVAELLRAQERWGATRTRRLLDGVQVGESRELGKLTDRQRTVLAEALEGRS